ncbi:maltose O-acetyltransferase [Oxobacter pfennigii]|uniref:Maltose O-acetyltransferase n=1 Tax=Oxobacter pfennigii TaxID=36849 RepID=A0A0P9AEE5_9CLOT|nr:acyltransferase [Oxobacter pfennigii]KPU43690.1 maltose O-acetyltransferase [Oxobacter pfennigii]
MKYDTGINNTVETNENIDWNKLQVSIAGNNNSVIIKTNNIESCELDVKGDNHEIIICENSIIKNLRVNVRSSDSIHTNCSSLKINENTIIENTQVFLQGDNTRVSIGKGTTILGCLFFAVECDSNISIGEECMLSWGIEIRTSDWHSIYDIETNERINMQKSVYLHNRVWIGSYAVILKGVNIDSDSIVGTHSIVTKSVPSNCIVAGNPAKIIRENVRWGREDYIHKNK